MRFVCLFAAAMMAIPTVAEEQPDDTMMEKMQGRWEIVEGWNRGQSLAKSEIEGSYVMVKTNQITTFDSDQRQTYQAMFRIDDSKKPVRIQMTALPRTSPAEENNSLKQPTEKQPAASGILKFVDEGKWVLCYALPGAEPPTKFESAKGSKTMMFVMERRKVDDGLVQSISPQE
ncbi:TIGR03067 domain-containing protein [Roseiconus lacunae]|uniref:TIGR03067 domain-containing protein n=1 Tax=Roseiconus lacunae TaxID=2605694 RepID=A0ABT7PQH9_9BACT|nr:TIGR03067 domain-containing protein [Roseiconus lacunae]MDM4018581.1 TIGR03067 domain-containing protein [Roseiconus lacunae]